MSRENCCARNADIARSTPPIRYPRSFCVAVGDTDSLRSRTLIGTRWNDLFALLNTRPDAAPASGVFRAGGDLAYHHGGPSLQELVIPVLTVRTKGRESARRSAGPITASALPDAVTNRIFSVTLTFGEKQLMLGVTGIQVRPLLMSAGKQVGAMGMAIGARFDTASGCVMLEPDKPVTVAFLLTDESARSSCRPNDSGKRRAMAVRGLR
jgi:hypothetical protein